MRTKTQISNASGASNNNFYLTTACLLGNLAPGLQVLAFLYVRRYVTCQYHNPALIIKTFNKTS